MMGSRTAKARLQRFEDLMSTYNTMGLCPLPACPGFYTRKVGSPATLCGRKASLTAKTGPFSPARRVAASGGKGKGLGWRLWLLSSFTRGQGRGGLQFLITPWKIEILAPRPCATSRTMWIT